MSENIYCKIYLNSNDEIFFDGITYTENELFVVEFKTTELNIIDKILNNKAIYTKSQEGCLMEEPEKKFTYYDISKFKNSHYTGYSIITVYAKKRLVNLFSQDIKEELINGFIVTTDGLLNFFYDDYKYSQIIDKKLTAKLDGLSFDVETERLFMKIDFWKSYSQKSDKIILFGKTSIELKYKKSVEFHEAIEDTELLKNFFSFCSNRVYNIKFESIYGIKNDFTIEESNKQLDNQVGLFAFSYKNFNDNTGFLKAIKIIFENRNFYQRIFNQFYRTVGNEKTLNLENFSQWISVLEFLYDAQYKKIKNHNKTLEEINKIINNSSELTDEQKTIFIQRAKGFIDNPLKEKIIKILEESNNIYFKIESALFEKNSVFLSKILNTRNFYTHNTKKEIFNAIEIDKMNCFFKVCVFINIVKNLNAKISNFYYERIKYFFDLINFEPKN